MYSVVSSPYPVVPSDSIDSIDSILHNSNWRHSFGLLFL